jgi:hypothetical protein
MGVDIYGKAPKLIGKKPELDFSDDNITEEQKKDYWDALEKWEEKNPGYYFRSNWWGWRPIVMLCAHAAEQHRLEFNFDQWMGNDGLGLDNWQECNALADALELSIAEEENLKDDEDTIYCNMGSWTQSGGNMVDEEITDKLNEDYPYGSIMFTSIVSDSGNIYYPSHGTPLWLIKEFIKFLRNCGGFSIW